MTVGLLSPSELLQGTPYHHVAAANGSRHIHVSGQIAWIADGSAVDPGDLAGQVSQALRNTATGLASADASFADVASLTFYVTGWSPEMIGAFMADVDAVAGEIGLPMPPASLIGVDYLFESDVLVEVEATAVAD